MPYTTVATNDVLTASHFNTNYRDQVVSTVTSGTRPSGTEGQIIYETDTDKFYAYNGTGWQLLADLGSYDTYTLSVSGAGWALGNATVTSIWTQRARTVHMLIGIVWGSTSTYGGSALQLSLPTNHRGSTFWPCSVFAIDSAVRVPLFGELSSNLVTPKAIVTSGTYGAEANLTTSVPFTWTTGDQLWVNAVYESSS